MPSVRTVLRGALALAIAASAAASANATTLLRASLDRLVSTNETIVVGEVLDVHSYWNAEGNFILTDVRVAAADVLKGSLAGRDLTVTLMGGRVGETTTLIVGGAQLIPGRAYVLFLGESDLPGVKHALTVRDHSQGAFDLVLNNDSRGLRAISQANGHPLVPDQLGSVDAAGGAEGYPYHAMVESIREIARRPAAANREVE